MCDDKMQSIRSRASLIVAFFLHMGCAGASASPPQDEARVTFERFVAAQNAHDSERVADMLWNSPDFLLICSGGKAHGISPAMALYRNFYQGTWHLQPDMSQFSAVVLTPNLVQILVPIVFTQGPMGAIPQQTRYLISQSLLRQYGRWRIASVMPIQDLHNRSEN